VLRAARYVLTTTTTFLGGQRCPLDGAEKGLAAGRDGDTIIEESNDPGVAGWAGGYPRDAGGKEIEPW
jgi:hypothetical protein